MTLCQRPELTPYSLLIIHFANSEGGMVHYIKTLKLTYGHILQSPTT